MTNAAADVNTDSKGDGEGQTYVPTQAYAPSWVDRFTAWVTRLPGPSWSYYLGIGIVVFLLQTAVLWGEGDYAIGSFLAIQGFLAMMVPAWLALIHYLDDKAAAALAALRPALAVSETEYGELRFRLTTLPARPTLLASQAGVTFIVLLSEWLGWPVSFDQLASSPISDILTKMVYVILWGVWSAFVYHTVHQVRTINLIYTRYTRVNLFRMRPLYALSSVTAITAGSLTAAIYAFYALNDLDLMLNDPVTFGIAFAVTIFAFVIFIWPQLGIHHLQATEKGRLLDEINKRFEATMLELHQRLDSGELEGIGELNTALSSLELEKNAIRKMATWPWEPETVRLLITALALPLGLWLVQYVLQRALG